MCTSDIFDIIKYINVQETTINKYESVSQEEIISKQVIALHINRQILIYVLKYKYTI